MINIAAKISIPRRGYNTFSLSRAMHRGVMMRVIVPMITGAIRSTSIFSNPSLFFEINSNRDVL